jgi:hypothetical protein
MGSKVRRWVVVGFVLLLAFVAAFTAVTLLVPLGFSVPTTFQVSPAEVSLRPGQGRQFRAVHEGRPVQGVTWTATDGRIGPEGFYTAPETPSDYQVTAYHPTTGYSASATVHVSLDGVETPSPLALPTEPGAMTSAVPTQPEATPTEENPVAATPSESPTITPSQVTPEPTTISTSVPMSGPDPENDLFDYTTLAPIDDAPLGSDILLACFDADLQLVRTVPPELAGEVGDWNLEENLVLWITLHEPVPQSIDTSISWLFALDTDDDPTTGRPLNTGVINPDIGSEVTVGVRLDQTGEVYPYIYTWNAATGNSDLTDTGLEARFSTARDAVFIRVPMATLTTLITSSSQTEPNWDSVVGRAAILVVLDDGPAIDFFPERP